MTRRFRFGVSNQGTSPGEWQDFAKRAEDMGYSTLVISDHFAQTQLAPLPALVAAATVTSTLRIAAVVLNNDFRHPAVMAKEAATVDVLSGGRFELGLGAGWEQGDYSATGITFASPRERLERLAETVQICKAFFTEETVTFRGAHYQLDSLACFPRSLQKPHPPIMIGGRQRRLLSFAAREADIVGVSVFDGRDPFGAKPPQFDEKIEWIRQAAGPRFEDIELQVNAPNMVVTDDADTVVDQIAVRQRVSAADVLASPATLVGSVDSIIERMHTLRERYGLSYFVVPNRAAESLAPVVARATGC